MREKALPLFGPDLIFSPPFFLFAYDTMFFPFFTAVGGT